VVENDLLVHRVHRQAHFCPRLFAPTANSLRAALVPRPMLTRQQLIA